MLHDKMRAVGFFMDSKPNELTCKDTMSSDVGVDLNRWTHIAVVVNPRGWVEASSRCEAIAHRPAVAPPSPPSPPPLPAAISPASPAFAGARRIWLRKRRDGKTVADINATDGQGGQGVSESFCTVSGPEDVNLWRTNYDLELHLELHRQLGVHHILGPTLMVQARPTELADGGSSAIRPRPKAGGAC